MILNIHAQKMSFGHARDTLWVHVTGCCRMEASLHSDATAEKQEGDECTVFLGGPIEAKMLADAIYGYCRERVGKQAQEVAVLAADLPEEGSLEAIERAQDAALGEAERAEI